ncbi:MAG: TIGR03118 family protein [Acidimicrobiaceae bacterium]|nr:TIGR03118 family protein [Acidimicrobiaceae bacterium]
MRLAGVVATAASAATMGLVGVAPAGAVSAHEPGMDNAFTRTNLVSNVTTLAAQLHDPHLANPWGVAAGPGGPLWVSDNNGVNAPGGRNVTTVYTGAVKGSPVSPLLDVVIPGGRASTGDSSSPTGQVFNPTKGFTVTSSKGSGPADFIFDSESGQITAWNPTADPISPTGHSTAQLFFSSRTAVYKGLTEGRGPNGPDLFATNFHDGTVDVFNSKFQKMTPTHGLFSFHDPSIPPGFAPFGIKRPPNGLPLLFVTYAKQDAAKHDDVAAPGAGFVDVYTTSGFLLAHFARGGTLNAPWGIAFAPASFGPFGDDILIGNFGDGRINVFNLFGRFLGQLDNSMGQPITIDGLWALHFGNSAFGGNGSLIFTAGPNDENDGLLGVINPSTSRSPHR